ncbi:uncharacterized protein J3R85_005799 [Psidium guajava]|nr:uncharacterized protein J3R85_005799 [Psidium guajava]
MIPQSYHRQIQPKLQKQRERGAHIKLSLSYFYTTKTTVELFTKSHKVKGRTRHNRLCGSQRNTISYYFMEGRGKKELEKHMMDRS